MVSTAEWNTEQHGDVATGHPETLRRDRRPIARQVLIAIILLVAFMAGTYLAFQATRDPVLLPTRYETPAEATPDRSWVPERDGSALH